MRGKIGQNPVIIDVPYGSDTRSTSISTEEDSEPETPPSSTNDHRGRLYPWKSEHNKSGVAPMDRQSKDARVPSKQPSKVDLQINERGRRSMPKLDTEFARSRSTSERLPQLERARSPYASGPQDRKAKESRFSGEHLLSPETMSPRPKLAESRRSHSHYDSRAAEPHPDRAKDSPMGPTRPPLGRHASAYEYRTDNIPSSVDPRGRINLRPGRPPMDDQHIQPYHAPRGVEVHDDKKPTNTPPDSPHLARSSMEPRRSQTDHPESIPLANAHRLQSRTHQEYSDSSDDDPARIRAPPSHFTPQIQSPKATKDLINGRHKDREPSSQCPDPRRSLTPTDPDAPPVNLRSLVSGDGIHQVLHAAALNAALSRDSPFARRASPRPSPHPSPGVSPLGSPHDSPAGSPHTSPPRTPPNGRRGNPVVSLKKDSPTSRPSSPLSSHSSTLNAVPSRKGHTSESREDFRPPPLKSRHTTPVVSPPVDDSKQGLAPGIVVRSPSPAMHALSLSTKPQAEQHPHMRADSVASPISPLSSTLRPGFSGRPRAASSADIRPQLTVNPTPFMQPSVASPSRGSKSRGSSPAPMSPADRYKPAYMTASSPTVTPDSSHQNPSIIGSEVRARPFLPNSASPVSRSHSALPSSPAMIPPLGSYPALPTRPVKPLPSLPLCPRTKRIAGYDDWNTFRHKSAFMICSECSHNVFGADSGVYLVHKPVSAGRKVKCDLNNPWIRLACLLRGPDVDLLRKLSDVTSMEGRCPEDYTEPKDWYRLEDPETEKHVAGFYACPECVHSLNLLFPSWREVFYRGKPSHGELKERSCSLRERGFRFGDFLDMIVQSAQQAEKKKQEPDTKHVVKLAKQLASITDCPRDKMLPQKSWHVHSHMPEFTICQDCYEEVIYPLAKGGSSIALKFDQQPQGFPNPDVAACCQLYSDRMRTVFREACEDNDWEHLRHTAMKRHMLQQDILGTLGESKEFPDDDEIRDRLGEKLQEWKKLE